MKDYYDDNHANFMLNNTYAYIQSEQQSICVHIYKASIKYVYYIYNDIEYKINMNRKDLVLNVDQLGYVNTRYQCVYVSRKPKRMWKTGITDDNISLNYVFPDRVTIKDYKDNYELLETLYNGVFPSYKAALLCIKDGIKACAAFSRKFAVGLTFDTLQPVIYYKNIRICYINNDNIAVLGDVNIHLLKQLEELGVEVLV